MPESQSDANPAVESQPVRLTQYARGGGCACKIPPGELDALLSGLALPRADLRIAEQSEGDLPGADLSGGNLLIGDDAAVVRLPAGPTLVTTTDFFTPVVDDPYDFGRIAACNALSDVYAMGGTPVVALNLLAWPRDRLSLDLARQVLRGGYDVTAAAGCLLGGGHSIDDHDPKYGLAVTGTVVPAELIRLDAGAPGTPLSLTKPLGTGILNNRHKATGERFPDAVEAMTILNREASRAAVRAGIRCGTDVTGFGLLGHAYRIARASGVTAVIDAAAVPYLDGARDSADSGYVSGGTRRNLAWVTPHTDFGATDGLEQLLLADAQTSGGLLLAGEIPGAPVIGELRPRGDHPLVVR